MGSSTIGIVDGTYLAWIPDSGEDSNYGTTAEEGIRLLDLGKVLLSQTKKEWQTEKITCLVRQHIEYPKELHCGKVIKIHENTEIEFKQQTSPENYTIWMQERPFLSIRSVDRAKYSYLLGDFCGINGWHQLLLFPRNQYSNDWNNFFSSCFLFHNQTVSTYRPSIHRKSLVCSSQSPDNSKRRRNTAWRQNFQLVQNERKQTENQRKQDRKIGQQIKQMLINWNKQALSNTNTIKSKLELKSVQVTPLTSNPQNLTFSLELLITLFQSHVPSQNLTFFVSCTPTHTQAIFHCQTFSAVCQTPVTNNNKSNTVTLKCRVDCSCHSSVAMYGDKHHENTLGDLAISILCSSGSNQHWEANMLGRIPLPSFELFIISTNPSLHLYPITTKKDNGTQNLILEYRNPRILVLDMSSSPSRDLDLHWIQHLQSKLHSSMDIHISRQQHKNENYDSKTASNIILSLFANTPTQRLALVQVVLKHMPKHVKIIHTMTGDSAISATPEKLLFCLQKELDLIASSSPKMQDLLLAQTKTDYLLSQMLTTSNVACIPTIL